MKAALLNELKGLLWEALEEGEAPCDLQALVDDVAAFRRECQARDAVDLAADVDQEESINA